MVVVPRPFPATTTARNQGGWDHAFMAQKRPGTATRSLAENAAANPFALVVGSALCEKIVAKLCRRTVDNSLRLSFLHPDDRGDVRQWYPLVIREREDKPL
jgi:hypothetical protein